jgi:hypothetical protein
VDPEPDTQAGTCADESLRRHAGHAFSAATDGTLLLDAR